MKTDNIPQRSKEWHDARRGMITASVIGAILDHDPYRGPNDIMRMMVRDYLGEPREFEGNAATEWGTYCEPCARNLFEMEYGHVQECGFFVHPTYAYFGASPDGLVGSKGILEIKCPYSQRSKNPPDFKKIRQQVHYYDQVQFQLFCTGREFCKFYQWAPYGDSIEEVLVDRQWRETNIPILKEFYKKYLIERESNDSHIHPLKKGIDTDQSKRLVDLYFRLESEIKYNEERKKGILDELVKISGETDSIICGHSLTKVKRNGAISYAKVVKDLLPNVDIEGYRGEPTEYWILKK